MRSNSAIKPEENGMAFRTFETTRFGARGVDLDMEEEGHKQEIEDALAQFKIQKDRIIYLHDRGWAPHQMQKVLKTMGKPVTAVYISQVVGGVQRVRKLEQEGKITSSTRPREPGGI
jgi:hypothetical protein